MAPDLTQATPSWSAASRASSVSGFASAAFLACASSAAVSSSGSSSSPAASPSTAAFDAGVVAIGDKRNIGMVCKAASDSTSLYAYGIVQNTADYNEGDIVLRFGFIKD